MDSKEIKAVIAAKVAEGMTLSQIQDELKAQGVKMTFMELRLLASEIESGVFKKQEAAAEPKKKEEPPAPAAEESPEEAWKEENAAGDAEAEDGMPYPRPPAAGETPSADNAAAPIRGKTTVTISPIQRPGYMLSGTATFGSGASGEWVLDQMGRLGFEKLNGKPDKQDIQEFQLELQKAVGA